MTGIPLATAISYALSSPCASHSSPYGIDVQMQGHGIVAMLSRVCMGCLIRSTPHQQRNHHSFMTAAPARPRGQHACSSTNSARLAVPT